VTVSQTREGIRTKSRAFEGKRNEHRTTISIGGGGYHRDPKAVIRRQGGPGWPTVHLPKRATLGATKRGSGGENGGILLRYGNRGKKERRKEDEEKHGDDRAEVLLVVRSQGSKNFDLSGY